MGGLFGSSPSVSQGPAPSPVPQITPDQARVQNLLATLLSNYLPSAFGRILTEQPALPPPFGGQYSAPLTGQQTALIGDIGSAVGPTGAAGAPLTSAQSALTSVLSGQPQDYSQYFQQDIAQPLENTFRQQTLPTIEASLARSAGDQKGGGGLNTGEQGAVTQATENLNQTLGQAATALGTQATTTAAQQRLQGIGLAPGISGQQLGNLTTALGAAGLPQQQQQLQLTGQQQQASQALQFLTTLLGGSTNFSNAPTVGFPQGNTAVNPGSIGAGTILGAAAIPGLMQGLFSGGSTAGMGGLLGGISDPRLKDIDEGDNTALAVLKKLNVKKAKFKWEPPSQKRLMLMADNVEKVLPTAAARIAGIGMVKPHELIPLLIRGVQELAQKAA